MELVRIARDLADELDGMRFTAPAATVYNPLRYAREPHEAYLARYGAPPKAAVFLGMNPGPWGMAQTGVPFGEVELVRNWLGIAGEVVKPACEHPKKKIDGFACRRSEVSGRRFWGLVRERFQAPENFFRRFFVANYCPLLFLDADGRNITPDKLPREERACLQQACDRALLLTVKALETPLVIGIGGFARSRAEEALVGLPVAVATVLHPSPANPEANRDWRGTVLRQLAAEEIDFR